MKELLDELVPVDERPGDWDDVLRRARSGRRTRLVAVAAVFVAVVAVAPAVAVLARDHAPQLPAGADRSNVLVVLQPATGVLLAEVAPWKGHDGFCYLVLQRRAGCVANGKTGAVALTFPPIFGWSFGDRVRSATATSITGKNVPLLVVHFGGRIDATFVTTRNRLPLLYRSIVMRDADGRVIARFRR
jgi:hypothetical protein